MPFMLVRADVNFGRVGAVDLLVYGPCKPKQAQPTLVKRTEAGPAHTGKAERRLLLYLDVEFPLKKTSQLLSEKGVNLNGVY